MNDLYQGAPTKCIHWRIVIYTRCTVIVLGYRFSVNHLEGVTCMKKGVIFRLVGDVQRLAAPVCSNWMREAGRLAAHS